MAKEMNGKERHIYKNPIAVRDLRVSSFVFVFPFISVCVSVCVFVHVSYPRQGEPNVVAICVNSGWLFKPFILHTNATGPLCNVL